LERGRGRCVFSKHNTRKLCCKKWDGRKKARIRKIYIHITFLNKEKLVLSCIKATSKNVKIYLLGMA
jgi:hypothetical protein